MKTHEILIRIVLEVPGMNGSAEKDTAPTPSRRGRRSFRSFRTRAHSWVSRLPVGTTITASTLIEALPGLSGANARLILSKLRDEGMVKKLERGIWAKKGADDA